LIDFEVMNAEKLKQLEAQVRIGGKVNLLFNVYCEFSTGLADLNQCDLNH